jgi:hypothetical protein
MPTVLRDEQHELMSIDGAESLVFGTADTGYLTTAPMVVERSDPRLGDTDRPRESGTQLGEDYQSSKSVTFEMGVLSDIDPLTHRPVANPKAENSSAVNAIERMWNLRAFRRSYASVAVLRSNIGGRTTRAYGRPRRFAPAPADTTKRGWTPLVADFYVPDGLWYDDVPQSVEAGVAPVSEGGVMAPFIAPFVTTSVPTSSASAFTVGGTEPTWPVFVFHAEASSTSSARAVISQDGVPIFSVGLSSAIPAATNVIVDSRPWSRGARRSDGAGAVLDYATPPLKAVQLDRGTYAVKFTAQDPSATAWVEVQWANAVGSP